MVDVEKQKLKKSVKKSKRVRWRVWKLKEKEIKEKFEESENWWTLIQRNCGGLIRIEFYRLVMNCRSEKESIQVVVHE